MAEKINFSKEKRLNPYLENIASHDRIVKAAFNKTIDEKTSIYKDFNRLKTGIKSSYELRQDRILMDLLREIVVVTGYHMPFLVRLHEEFLMGKISDYLTYIYEDHKNIVNEIFADAYFMSYFKAFGFEMEDIDQDLYQVVKSTDFLDPSRNVKLDFRSLPFDYDKLNRSYVKHRFLLPYGIKEISYRRDVDRLFEGLTEDNIKLAIDIRKNSFRDKKDRDAYRKFLKAQYNLDYLGPLKTQVHQKHSALMASLLAIIDDGVSDDLFIYIFKNYIGKFYILFKWEFQEETTLVYIDILERIMDHFRRLVEGYDKHLFYNIKHENLYNFGFEGQRDYQQKLDLYFNKNIVTSRSRIFFEGDGDLADYFTGIIDFGKDYIFKYGSQKLIDNIFFLALYFSKFSDEKTDILLRLNAHYEKISKLTRISPMFLRLVYDLIRSGGDYSLSRKLLETVNNDLSDISINSNSREFEFFEISKILKYYLMIIKDKEPRNEYSQKMCQILKEGEESCDEAIGLAQENCLPPIASQKRILYAFNSLAEFPINRCDSCIDKNMVSQARKKEKFLDDTYAYTFANEIRPYISRLQLEADYYFHQKQKDEIDYQLKRIERLKNSIEDQEEVYAMASEIMEDLSDNLLRLEGNPDEKIQELIKGYELSFLDDLDEADDFDLYQDISEDFKEDVYNGIFTSETVFAYLEQMKNQEAIDYSSAIILLTKLIENYGYRFFMAVREDMVQYPDMEKPIWDLYKKAEKNPNHVYISLMDLVYMLTDNSLAILLQEDGKYHLQIEEKLVGYGFALSNRRVDKGAFDPYRSFDNRGAFYELGLDKYIDISKLRKLDSIDLDIMTTKYIPARKSGLKFYPERMGRVNFSKDDDRKNRYALAYAINYIRDSYRNKVAHKDPFSKEKAEECRQMIVLYQKIIWILIYITKGI